MAKYDRDFVNNILDKIETGVKTRDAVKDTEISLMYFYKLVEGCPFFRERFHEVKKNLKIPKEEITRRRTEKRRQLRKEQKEREEEIRLLQKLKEKYEIN
ncbi:MAG: hypothetical protein LBH46_01390 [Rickettsiales bacterium]|jgi:protein subunit release factor B|nr:hypothetical protein [Rickettsiales bacterium]